MTNQFIRILRVATAGLAALLTPCPGMAENGASFSETLWAVHDAQSSQLPIGLPDHFDLTPAERAVFQQTASLPQRADLTKGELGGCLYFGKSGTVIDRVPKLLINAQGAGGAVDLSSVASAFTSSQSSTYGKGECVADFHSHPSSNNFSFVDLENVLTRRMPGIVTNMNGRTWVTFPAPIVDRGEFATFDRMFVQWLLQGQVCRYAPEPKVQGFAIARERMATDDTVLWASLLNMPLYRFDGTALTRELGLLPEAVKDVVEKRSVPSLYGVATIRVMSALMQGKPIDEAALADPSSPNEQPYRTARSPEAATRWLRQAMESARLYNVAQFNGGSRDWEIIRIKTGGKWIGLNILPNPGACTTGVIVLLVDLSTFTPIRQFRYDEPWPN